MILPLLTYMYNHIKTMYTEQTSSVLIVHQLNDLICLGRPFRYFRGFYDWYT